MNSAAVHRLSRDERLEQPLDLTPTLPPLTVQQTARTLNFSVDSIYDGIRRGEIKALRLGRAVRIPRAEIARLLQVSE